jgi:hypothetical protein
MDFGKIKRQNEPIMLAEWQQVIEGLPDLSQMPDRERTNPFTLERIVVSGEGQSLYSESGNPVGNASLENGEILTTGIPLHICLSIARALSADVYQDDRS